MERQAPLFLKARRLMAAAVPVLVLAACTPSTPVPPTPVPPTPPDSTNAPLVFPLAGAWSGTIRNGTYEMQISVTLAPACGVGSLCGSFDNTTVPCSGSYTLLGENGGVFQFQPGDEQGSCAASDEFLQPLADGSLQYTSRGSFGESTGNLLPQIAAATAAPQSSALPVIYDDDGSPDGTTALLYLVSDPAATVQAALISHGEAHPKIYIQYIGRLLDHFGMPSVPLGAGQDTPLVGNADFPEWLRQSADNFWGLSQPNQGKTYPVQDAATLLVATLNRSSAPVTIFVSGPCTDLALALRRDPGIRSKIAAVVIMGGAVYAPGNLSDLLPNPTDTVAEWNIYADPQAAKEVFASGLPIYLVPLDATNLVKVTKADTARWRTGASKGDFAADIYDMLLGSSSTGSMAIWDVMTAEIALHPELCGFEKLSITVDTNTGNTFGQTAIDRVGQPNVNVCLRPDPAAIRNRLVTAFAQGQ